MSAIYHDDVSELEKILAACSEFEDICRDCYEHMSECMCGMDEIIKKPHFSKPRLCDFCDDEIPF